MSITGGDSKLKVGEYSLKARPFTQLKWLGKGSGLQDKGS